MNATEEGLSPPPPATTVAQFMELRLELVSAVAEIGQLAEAGFGKRPLLKKDFVSLLQLMQEAVASARYTVAFLKLIFKPRTSAVPSPTTSGAMSSSTTPHRLLARHAEAARGILSEDAEEETGDVDLLLSSLIKEEDRILFDSDSCEVSPKNVLELASDRGFDEDGGEPTETRGYGGHLQVAEEELLAGTNMLERSHGCHPQQAGRSLEQSHDCDPQQSGSILERSHSFDKQFSESILERSNYGLDAKLSGSILERSNAADAQLSCSVLERSGSFDAQLSCSVLERSHGGGDANVSNRRRRKANNARKGMLGSSSIEESLADIDAETLQLLESGKLDISQLSGKTNDDELLMFSDVCRLNVAIFDSPPLAAAATSNSPLWIGYRESSRQRQLPSDWRSPAVDLADLSDCSFAAPASSSPALLPTPAASSSFVLRESVIARSQHNDATPLRSDCGRPYATTAASSTSPPPATPTGKYSKEIDQKESPKLLVLIDTRFSVREEESEERQEEEERPTAWEQQEPISPILGLKSAKILSTPVPDGVDSGGRLSSSRDSSAIKVVSEAAEPEPLHSGSPRRLAARDNNKCLVRMTDSEDNFSARADAAAAAAVLSNSTFNSDHQVADCRIRTYADVVVGDGCHADLEGGESTYLKPIMGRQRSKSRNSGGRKTVVGFRDKSVFYFMRQQSWCTVPKEGGNSLGMAYRHTHEETLLIPDKEEVEENNMATPAIGDSSVLATSFEAEPSDRPRKTLRLSSSCGHLGNVSESEHVWKSSVKKPGVLTLTRVSEGKEELTHPLLQAKARKIRASSRNTMITKSAVNLVSLESSMAELASPELTPKARKGECGTRGLFRIGSRARRGLLRSGGCLDPDPEEAEANKVLRQSRQNCGCSCAGPCRPASCECAEAGALCHEERQGTPCACTADMCGNPAGRRRFDPTAVKMHFLQAMIEVQGALSIC